MQWKPVKLTADLVEAFAGTFLSGRYDNPVATPDFHREVWKLYCSPERQAGCVAPRGHAKSTGFTFAYGLAEVMFRCSRYVILIGSTEDKAAEQLSNISEEISGNADLRREFGIKDFESEQKTDIIVRCVDGHRFRIIARGSEQKIRGAMWDGRRPDLILMDDAEDDEQVENKVRRRKFRRWFFRAAKQSLSRTGKIRVHGTILHEDSLLSRLRKNSVWKFLFFKAHKAYDDFSERLWPQGWSRDELLSKRREFEQDGDPGGYSQEYLNTPLDFAEAYIKRQHLIPMTEEDRARAKVYGVGVDLAISKEDAANKTAFIIGGVDTSNSLHIVDRRTDRMDALEIIDEFFNINERWKPQCFWVESGQIWLAIKAIIYREMETRGIPLIIVPCKPIKDKAARGRAFQKRTRTGTFKVDMDQEWSEPYTDVICSFTGESAAKEDDDFDGTAWLALGFEESPEVIEDDFVEDEEWDARRESRDLRSQHDGRSCTGY